MTATIPSTMRLAPMNPMDLYDGKNISTHLVLIDPDIALHWLGEYLDTSANRPINPARVARYFEDMRAGRWKLTHQGVGTSNGGVLVDGQHRLHAIMESGTAVVMSVTVGVDESSFTAIDTGGVRTAADLAHVVGHPKYRTLTPAITLMVYFHRNDFYDVPAAANKAFTQAAVLEFAAELDWDKLVAAAESVQNAPKGFSRTALGAFYYLAVYDRKIDLDIVTESFFRLVFTGYGVTEERDPRLVLRIRRIHDPFSTARTRQELLGGITRAWNNHMQGASIRSLVMPDHHAGDRPALPWLPGPVLHLSGPGLTHRPASMTRPAPTRTGDPSVPKTEPLADTAPLPIVVQEEFVDIIRETVPADAAPVIVGAVADPDVQAKVADAARR